MSCYLLKSESTLASWRRGHGFQSPKPFQVFGGGRFPPGKKDAFLIKITFDNQFLLDFQVAQTPLEPTAFDAKGGTVLLGQHLIFDL